MAAIKCLMSTRLILTLTTFSMWLFVGTASAHTAYLVPATFEPLRTGVVTLDASFAEKFFVPDVTIDETDFHVIDPKGKKSAPDTLQQLSSRAVLEHKLEQDGTYKFSTGIRHGAEFRIYELEGERKVSRDKEEELPKGAKLLQHFRSITKAESYVSKGAPNQRALNPVNEGLEIQLLSHPNDLFVGDAVDFKTLFKGEPVAELEVDIYLAADQFSSDKAELKVTTDKKGKASFAPEQQGLYLLRIRHRSPAPENAGVPLFSYTYSVVVEVLD